ncbi:hypothetical protein [Virgibacillus halodenitrificans]|uniref:hypothetical protein n=1 Tax=Virgibacillus halodenitrificans TaxID=1482 RepID=UPI0002DB7F4D|nr:hypothetical protein [Virgibacillus halodenitrificans]
MGKYWKLLTILVVIVLSVGTFYITTAIAGNSSPDFKFKLEKGDIKDIQNLKLVGDYLHGMNGEGVAITSDDTVYSSELSYFSQLNNSFYTEPAIQQLQKDYRGFMRGKTWHTATISQDEEQVVYANVKGNDFTNKVKEFEIELLNKKTNNKTTFTVDIPHHEKYNYVNVENVNLIDGKVKLVTLNYLSNQDQTQDEIYLYQIDLKKQKVIEDKVIYSNTVQKQQNSSLYRVESGNTTSFNDYTVFMKDTFKEMKDEYGNYYEEIGKSELIAVNMQTGKVTTFTPPPELDLMRDGSTFAVSGSKLYFLQADGKGYEVLEYDLEKAALTKKPITQLPESDSAPVMRRQVKAENNKLYIVIQVQSQKAPADVYVIDLKKQQTIVEGKLVSEKVTNDAGNYELYINDFYVNE